MTELERSGREARKGFTGSHNCGCEGKGTRSRTVYARNLRSCLLSLEHTGEGSTCQELMRGRRRQDPSHGRPLSSAGWHLPLTSRALPTLLHSAPSPGSLACTDYSQSLSHSGKMAERSSSLSPSSPCYGLNTVCPKSVC